ncbi:sensor histidine kinase [Luteolibacter sp. AS25]|uniref:sensor histidine kinase n=1 Tax=Luteolibacter sp. AS25 TaxID=3135776 RepID=UPI00398AC4DD
MSSDTEAAVRLLVIEDNDDHWFLFQRALNKSRESWAVKSSRACTLEEGKKLAGESEFDAVILDLNLPDSDHSHTISEGLGHFEGYPTIVLTALEDEKLGKAAIRFGAQDFLSKENIGQGSIRRSVRHAIERFEIQRDLKKRNQDLKLFAKTLAHEIRNPLHAVSATLERLLLKGTLEEKEKSLVDRAWQNACNIDDVISGLLVSALSTEGDEMLKLQVDKILGDAYEALGADEKNLGKFSIAMDSQMALGNPQALKQVFINLLSNSVRYRDGERPLEIEVRAEPIRISVKYLRIYLRDNGVGIPKGDIKKVCDPMFRSSSTAAREGTGLGLYYCKNAVQRMGGSLDIISKVGEGTTVVIDLLQEAKKDGNDSEAN